jgi:hypothetical protein
MRTMRTYSGASAAVRHSIEVDLFDDKRPSPVSPLPAVPAHHRRRHCCNDEHHSANAHDSNDPWTRCGGFSPSALTDTSTSVDGAAALVLSAGTVVINVCGTPRVVVGSAAVVVAGGARVVTGLVVANNAVVGTAGRFVVVNVAGGAVVVVMPRGVVDVSAVGGEGALGTPPGEGGVGWMVALGGTVVRGRTVTVRVRCLPSMTRVRDALPVTVLIFVRVPAGE